MDYRPQSPDLSTPFFASQPDMARRSSRIAQSDSQPVYEMPEDIQPLPTDPMHEVHESHEIHESPSQPQPQPHYQFHESPSSPQAQPVQSIAPAMADAPLGAGIEVKTKFPVARIKRIMQADEDVGKVAQVTPIAVCMYLYRVFGRAIPPET